MSVEPNKNYKSVKFKKSIKNIYTLFRLMWSKSPYFIISWILIIFISAGLPTLQIWLQKKSIDEISIVTQHTQSINYIILLVGSYYLCMIFINLINQFEGYIFSIIREDISFTMKLQITETATKLPVSFYEISEFYDSLKLAKESLSRGSIDVIKHILSIFKISLQIISLFFILATINWILPVALILSSLPGMVLILWSKKVRYRFSVSSSPVGREMEYTFHLLSAREQSKEIRVFDISGYLQLRWSNMFNKLRKTLLNQRLKEIINESIGVTILQVISFGSAVLLIWKISGGLLTVGDYVALSGAILMVQGFLMSIAQSIGSTYENLLYINYYFYFQEVSKQYMVKEVGVEFPRGKYDKIVVKNVSFSYHEQKNAMLKDISFTIHRGERIAIVGENGTGKSTLVNCLTGLYQVTEGEIYFGNVEISLINKSSLYHNVSVIFQDYVRYKYGLRENIGFGNIKEMGNDEKIANVLDKVGLTHLIEELPEGLDTFLGKEFYQGQDLSGGQWQRVAIARAFYGDAEVLILDEPTSSVDPIAELELFETFLKMSEGKTTIMISHRMGPARYADRILVLHEGQLIEQGTHKELMIVNGKYARMYNAQAQWYQ